MKLFIALLAVLVITGCSTYSASRYANNADSVVSLRNYQENKVAIGQFSASTPDQSSITCRGVGPIATPDGETFEKYIENAFIAELKLAEAYDESVANKINGNLDKIDFNSNSGHWYIDLTVTSLSGESYSVSESFKYKTSFYGETACNQTAQALMPAVQNVIHKVITNPKFETLVKQ